MLAVRISARFRFTLEDQTAAAIRSLAPEILVVSHERIAQELKKMLLHENRLEAVRLALDVHLLPAILPELKPLFRENDDRTTASRSPGRPLAKDSADARHAAPRRLNWPSLCCCMN